MYIFKEDYQVPTTLFIDQATKAGFSIWDSQGMLVASGHINREKEQLEEYADNLVKTIKNLANTYDITTIFYEEVFIGHPTNVETLYYIKHKITDLRFTDHFQVFGLHNKRWKALLRNGNKPKGKDKEDVLFYVKEYFDQNSMTWQDFTEDEIDALGMGIAVMVNGEGQFYDVSQYNKKLPVHWGVSSKDFEYLKTKGKTYTRFQKAMDIGGLYEIPLKSSKKIEDEFLKVLSHEDTLAFCIIPRTYKYWGYYLVLHNIMLDDIKESTTLNYLTKSGKRLKELDEDSYILYASRKKRM